MDNQNNMSIKKATALNALAKYSTVILQLVYTAILSRILSPDEYGIVAIVNVFIIFFQLFSDMGLGAGVVQDKSLDENDINNIYSTTIYIGIGLTVLFIICSFPISFFYGDQIYVSVGIILSFSILFNTFNTIPNAIVLKQKKFKVIAVRTVIVSMVAFSLTIYFAFIGFGVYALAANSVITAFGMFLWNELSTKLRFRVVPSVNSVKKIWGYSIFQFGAQGLNYFNRNLDNILIGKFFSVATLGQYNKAYTLTRYPVTYLPGVITPVLHPILSEHQEQPDYIYDTYMKLLKILSLLGCFGGAFCFFAGKEIIYVAFGTQWTDAILPFKMLSLSLWMQILTNTTAPIYQSLGNTKLLFKSTIYTTVLIVTSIIVGILLGNINMVSVAVSVAYILNFVVSFYMLIQKCFNKSFSCFIKNFWQEGVIFVVLMLSSYLWQWNVENYLIGFIAKLLYFLVVYLVMLVVLRQYKIFINIFKRR